MAKKPEIGRLMRVGKKSRLIVLDEAVGTAAEHLLKGHFAKTDEWVNFVDELPPALALVVTRTGPLSEGHSPAAPGELWSKYTVLYGRPEGQWRLANAKEKDEYRAECARLKAFDDEKQHPGKDE